MAKVMKYEDVVRIAEIADTLHINGCRYSVAKGIKEKSYSIQISNQEAGTVGNYSPDMVVKFISDYDKVARARLDEAKEIIESYASIDNPQDTQEEE